MYGSFRRLQQSSISNCKCFADVCPTAVFTIAGYPLSMAVYL